MNHRAPLAASCWPAVSSLPRSASEDAFEGAPLSPLDEGKYERLGSAPGSPGLYTFRYAAVDPGTVTLRFLYRRPWENEPPLDEVEFIVWVR